jgi:alpha-L-rhamnosidase
MIALSPFRTPLKWIAVTCMLAHHVGAAPVRLVEESPVSIKNIAPGIVLVDFGRAAFGNLRLLPPTSANGEIKVHFGESLTKGRVDRKPPGSVRYAEVKVTLAGQPVVAAPPADARNTKLPSAVLTPPDWGVVLPFRWVEIEGWPGQIQVSQLKRQAGFASTWDDSAATFKSSDPTLNKIWELCRYSIKATTFAGVYVDGDRERIPYEADAYLNQLSHYYTDPDPQMARDTYDHLMKHPTWPTEWASHMVFMAHADWMQTGDTAWIESRYEALKSKLLLDRARADGLIVSNQNQIKRDDIVDWPAAERDGYEFKPVNTVVNAFQIRSLHLMGQLATALHKETDAKEYAAQEAKARKSFQEKLFDPARGIYRDGEGTDHASQHANLFPLAFGLVPEEHTKRISAWLGKRAWPVQSMPPSIC